MKLVWKHTVPVDGQEHRFDLPPSARIVHVDGRQHTQGFAHRVDFWFEFDEGYTDMGDLYIPRTFFVVATGDPVHEDALHRGTATITPCVWHLYERWGV